MNGIIIIIIIMRIIFKWMNVNSGIFEIENEIRQSDFSRIEL